MKDLSAVSIDAVRSYWDGRPCNIRHSTEEIGSVRYSDEVEARKYLVEPHIPGFAEFPRWSGKKVLEIGCGIGTDTINFARSGADLTAVDLSQNSIQIAQQRLTAIGLRDRVNFVIANAEELPSEIKRGSYDLVYSFGVLHHTPNVNKAIDEAISRVAPGGTLKIMMYHRYSWKVLWILAAYGNFKIWRIQELISRYSEAETGCPVTYSYSKKEIKNILENKGLMVTDITVDHIFPYKISKYVKYQYAYVWYFRILPKALFRWLERRFGWHICVTAKKM